MSVTIDVAVPTKGDVEFDFTNSVMTAKTADDLTGQEAVDMIREAEASETGIRFDAIGDISGKVTIAGATATGIVNELLNWFIVSGKSSGSFIIKDGTLVKTGAGGEVFAVNNLVSQINILEVNGTIVSVGSGLSTEEHGWLEFLFNTDEGDWQIVGNQMIFKAAGGSEIARFNLYDKDGNPAMENVFRRLKV